MLVVVEEYVTIGLIGLRPSRVVLLTVRLLRTQVIGYPVVMEALGVSVTVIRPHLPPQP